MTRILGFTVLLLLGGGSLVHGLLFHRIAVEETKKREISVAVPTLPGVGELLPDSGHDAEPAAGEEKPQTKGKIDSDGENPFASPSSAEKPAGNSDNPFEGQADVPAPSDVKFAKVTEEYVDVSLEPESAIVRDMTFGGVELLANGHLKRTYSGKPPSLCPT
jgi:hypothetical protein